MKENKIEIETTKDGSHTLFLPHLNEHYHSSHGAIVEALHVYIKSGLEYKAKLEDKINLLEIGFGTGLNTILSLIFGDENNVMINYHSIEPKPLSLDIIDQLNYNEKIPLNKMYTRSFNTMHKSAFNTPTLIGDLFILKKISTELELTVLADDFYNVVYFDAFAPDKQPELWTQEIFEVIYRSMKKNAVLVTYCCKGIVKRTLKEVGFTIEKLAGPTDGKREMLRATKLVTN